MKIIFLLILLLILFMIPNFIKINTIKKEYFIDTIDNKLTDTSNQNNINLENSENKLLADEYNKQNKKCNEQKIKIKTEIIQKYNENVEKCNQTPCPKKECKKCRKDCVGKWSKCNKDCIKTYSIVTPAENGGMQCSYNPYDTQRCYDGEGDCVINTTPCPTTTMTPCPPTTTTMGRWQINSSQYQFSDTNKF